MSFTTLTAVNFVFVRIETRDGLVGWGEAACLGGPTWSEESAESISATLERYVLPWLVGRDATQIEALRLEMGKRVQGNPFARAAVEMALWDLNGRALGVPVHRLLGGRVRDRVPLSWSLAVVESRRRARRGAREGGQGAPHLQDQDGGASGGRGRRARAGDPRGRRARRPAARRRQSGLGPADRAAGHPGHGALRSGLRRAAGAALGPRRAGRDRAERDGADHGRRVVRLAAGRAGHRPARRRVDPGAQAHQVRGAGAHHGHRAHRRGRRPRLLRRLHDRDLARHRRLSAGRAGGTRR